MSPMDIFFLIILIPMAVKGLFRGLVGELSSLIGFILGLYVSFRFASLVEVWLRDATSVNTKYMYILAFLLTFAAVVILVHLLAKFIEKSFQITSLGFLNRLAGFAFGAMKGLVFIGAIVYVLELVDPNDRMIKEDTKQRSIFYGPMALVLPKVLPQIKEKVHEWNKDKPAPQQRDTIYEQPDSVYSI